MGAFTFPNNDFVFGGDYTPSSVFAIHKDNVSLSINYPHPATRSGYDSFYLTNYSSPATQFNFERAEIFYILSQTYTPTGVFTIPWIKGDATEPAPPIEPTIRYLTSSVCSSVSHTGRLFNNTNADSLEPELTLTSINDIKEETTYIDGKTCSSVDETVPVSNKFNDAKTFAEYMSDKICSKQEQLTVFNKLKSCSSVDETKQLTDTTHEVKQQLTVFNKLKSCSIITDMSDTVHSFTRFYYSETIPGSDYVPSTLFPIETKPEYDDGRAPIVRNIAEPFSFGGIYTPSNIFNPVANSYVPVDISRVIIDADPYHWDGAWSIFYNSDSYQTGGYRLSRCNIMSDAERLEKKLCSLLEEGMRPPPGRTPWIDYPRPPVDPDPPSGETIIVEEKDTYTMQNIISVTLDDGTTAIDFKSIALSHDADSYSWSFSGDLIDDSQVDSIKQLPDGSAVTLYVTINSYVWHVLVEKIKTTKTFGNVNISVSGRGLTGLLSKPYQQPGSMNVGSVMTIQQIADSIIPIDWSIVWDHVTWNVDGGAYSHINKTPIEALLDIAKNIGAIIVPSMDSKSITFQPRYPVLPWDFSTVAADIILPDDAISELTEEPVSSFQANGVYVHGDEIGGELGFVRLNGTAGDRLAATTNNNVMTDTIALRALGSRILAGQYAQPKIKAVKTFMDGTIVPMLSIGSLIQFNVGADEIKGIVNSIAISTNLTEVWQSVSIGENTPNTWVAFTELLPKDPMLVATLGSTDGVTSLMTMLDGGVVRVRGTGTVGNKYYIKSGEISGEAPNLTASEIVI